MNLNKRCKLGCFILSKPRAHRTKLRSPYSPLGILQQASPLGRSSDAYSGLRQRRKPPHPARSPSLREAAPTGDASGTPAAGCPLRAVGRTQPPTEGNPPTLLLSETLRERERQSRTGLTHRRSVYRLLSASAG